MSYIKTIFNKKIFIIADFVICDVTCSLNHILHLEKNNTGLIVFHVCRLGDCRSSRNLEAFTADSCLFNWAFLWSNDNPIPSSSFTFFFYMIIVLFWSWFRCYPIKWSILGPCTSWEPLDYGILRNEKDKCSVPYSVKGRLVFLAILEGAFQMGRSADWGEFRPWIVM